MISELNRSELKTGIIIEIIIMYIICGFLKLCLDSFEKI